MAQRGILDDAEKGETSPAAFGGFRRAGSRVGWWIDRDDAERPKGRRTKRTSTPAFGERGASTRRRGGGPEPHVTRRTRTENRISRGDSESTETTEMTETRESETGPARGSPRRRRGDRGASAMCRRSVSRGFDSRRRRRRRRSRVDRLGRGGGRRASTRFWSAPGARSRAWWTRATPPRRRVASARTAKFADWCLCAETVPRRRRVKALSNSELDILLQPWRARRNRADTAFEHFLDLVIALAEKFHARLEGADAVRAMLDTLDDVHCAVLVPPTVIVAAATELRARYFSNTKR